MEFLNIGPLELLAIIVIALLVLGPRDLAKTARSAGRFLNRMYKSDAWRTITRTSREIRDLPNRLARDAALEELDETLKSSRALAADPLRGVTDELNAELRSWAPSPKGAETQPSPYAPANLTPGPDEGLAAWTPGVANGEDQPTGDDGDVSDSEPEDLT
jgi:sec-independent protein translocase protein TatB